LSVASCACSGDSSDRSGGASSKILLIIAARLQG
jgi:hypothetical protein